MTITSIVPLPGGAITVSSVSLITVGVFDLLPPNMTTVAPVKWVPVTVMSVPPFREARVGEMPVIVGAAGVGKDFEGVVACGVTGALAFVDLSAVRPKP
jgi:hypothetical protein